MGGELNVGRTSTKIDAFDPDYTERNDRRLTPLAFIAKLGEFDLDPCGAPGHPTALEVWTPEEVGDGLSMPWSGRVWLNPPYGQTMPDWMRRLAEHGRGTALIPARTDTALFHDLVYPYASALLFLRGRLTFLDADGVPFAANAGHPSVLLAYGAADVAALEAALAAGTLAGHLEVQR